MPAAADAKDIGRPVPAKLEIEVLKKFMKFDSEYAEDKRREFPNLVKPPPGIGEAGTGGVEWVGLNPDPCKAKYLAKMGIVRGQDAGSKGGEPKQELVKKGFSLSGYLSTAPLPYPHWQGDLHGPFEKPKTAGSLSRAQSMPGTARDARSQCSKRTSMHSSAVTAKTRASIAEIVSEEVQRQLDKMSCHQHYLEQTMHLQGVPSCVKPAPTPADLKELIYYGTSPELQGRYAYLQKRHRIMPQERDKAPVTAAAEVGWKAYAGKGKFVGKQLARMKPPPDTLTIF